MGLLFSQRTGAPDTEVTTNSRVYQSILQPNPKNWPKMGQYYNGDKTKLKTNITMAEKEKTGVGPVEIETSS